MRESALVQPLVLFHIIHFSPYTLMKLPLDIDECTESSHTCVTNSLCGNTDPGFTCTCDEGYSATGDLKAD